MLMLLSSNIMLNVF